jgi:hypothetical protein
MESAPVERSVLSELDLLEARAQSLSLERRDLHAQIDRLYLSTPLDDVSAHLLDRLEEREQAVSSERRGLHGRIDGLRRELGLPRWREAVSIRGLTGGGREFVVPPTVMLGGTLLR